MAGRSWQIRVYFPPTTACDPVLSLSLCFVGLLSYKGSVMHSAHLNVNGQVLFWPHWKAEA